MNRLEFLEEENKTQRNKLKKFYTFLESLDSYTNNFDNLCDCYKKVQGCHDESCLTINIRKDVERLLL